MDTIELADGGVLLHEQVFLATDLADRYFVELLDSAPWEQKKAAFGHLQPRLTASYGDKGVTYFSPARSTRPSRGRRRCWRSSGESRASGAGTITAS